MSASLITSVVARPTSAIAADYWLHVEQVLPEDDTASLGEVATLVDELYGVDPCELVGGDSAVNEAINDLAVAGKAGETEEQLAARTEEEKNEFFQETVAENFDLDICDGNINGDYVTQVKVSRSHQDVPYKLNLINGEVTATTVVGGRHSQNITLENAASVTIDFPVLSGFSWAWRGSVVGVSGYQDGPEVTRSGSTLGWGEAVTGVLQVSYETVYDLVDITVFGTDDLETGECRLLCFYHGLLTELDLEAPTIDTDAELDRQKYCGPGDWTVGDGNAICWETHITEYRCRCTNAVAYSDEQRVEVSCPPEVRCGFGLKSCEKFLGTRTSVGAYIYCPGEDSRLGDIDFYIDACCNPPGEPLPHCSTYYSANNGDSADIEEILSSYREIYGDSLRAIAVYPEDGDCGYIKKTIDVPQRNCCDEATQLEWNYDFNPTTMGSNSSVYLRTTGGISPRTWKVSGDGFYFDGGQKTIVSSAGEEKLTTVGACGSAKITVTDGCTTAFGVVRADAGRWENMPDGEQPGVTIESDAGATGSSAACESASAGGEGAYLVVSGTTDQYRAVEQFCVVSLGDMQISYISFDDACDKTKTVEQLIGDAEGDIMPGPPVFERGRILDLYVLPSLEPSEIAQYRRCEEVLCSDTMFMQSGGRFTCKRDIIYTRLYEGAYQEWVC